MAAIDFPNAPTDGQLFTASNGAVYQWSASRGLWLSAPAILLADFNATFTSGNAPLSTSPVVVVFNTVNTGNSGGWYNPATGRFTPPAGRYFIQAVLNISANSAGTGCTSTVTLRKNGVVLVTDGAAYTTGFWSPVTVGGEFDANGTDYFEIFLNGSSAATSMLLLSGQAWLTAFPVGVVGTYPGSCFRLLSRQVISTPTPIIEYQNIPSDINDIEVRFDLTPATNGQDLGLQFYDGGGVLNTAGYIWSLSNTANNNALGGAPSTSSSSGTGITAWVNMSYGNAGNRVSSTYGIRGSVKANNIRDATRFKYVDFQCNYGNDPGTAVYSHSGSGGRTGAAQGFSGLRLQFTSGNIAAGSTMSVWGSP